jgi:hypothetical protein
MKRFLRTHFVPNLVTEFKLVQFFPVAIYAIVYLRISNEHRRRTNCCCVQVAVTILENPIVLLVVI